MGAMVGGQAAVVRSQVAAAAAAHTVMVVWDNHTSTAKITVKAGAAPVVER